MSDGSGTVSQSYIARQCGTCDVLRAIDPELLGAELFWSFEGEAVHHVGGAKAVRTQ